MLVNNYMGGFSPHWRSAPLRRTVNRRAREHEITVTDPAGPSTDPAGHSKTFAMDAFGNLTKVVEPDSSQTNTGRRATTTYVYDALNHLTQVSMPRQMPGGSTITQIRTFNYGTSPGAYLLSASNPENGIVSYSYNADGTLAWKLDAKGQKLKYASDSYGRVTTVSQ